MSEKREREFMKKTQPTFDIETLLGQATPRPWKITYDNADVSSGGQWYTAGRARIRFPYNSSEEIKDRAFADAALIVLAVNALPAFLKLKGEVRKIVDALNSTGDLGPTLSDGENTWPLGGEIAAKLGERLSEVDTALGLSPKPSSTPVDTSVSNPKSESAGASRPHDE